MNPDLLSQLRDIHPAPQAPWWPPAPGWWLLALLLLITLGWLGRRATRRYRVYQRRKQMLGWVDHLNVTIDPERYPQAYLSTLNRIFKVVALRAFPGHKCAALAGQDWVDFLASQIKDSDLPAALDVLASGPYDPAPQFDADSMSELTRYWIRRYG